MRKVQPSDQSIPCLICEEEVDVCFHPDTNLTKIAITPFSRGVHCATHGNYGSQVHDMHGVLHFVICDRCVIRHSNKMLFTPNGRPPRDHDPDLKNAQEMFINWWESLEAEVSEEERQRSNSYYNDVRPYFEELDE